MSVLVAVAGPMGSGKTSIASALAHATKGRRVSFGDAVRAEAKRRCLPTDRRGLQDLGEILIGEGWASFVELVLAGISDDIEVVVVDGVRHREAVSALGAFASNRRLVLLYVNSDVKARQRRLNSRDGMTAADYRLASAHRIELEVQGLRNLAHVVVDNNDLPDIETLAARVRDIA